MASNGMKFKSGIINVYKESGYTSHDVVQVLRKILGIKRIGHTGTLDPDVTGVLPVCINKATRLVEYIQNDGKTYIGTMKLGIATDTQDISGEVLETSDKSVTKEEVFGIIKEFTGVILQKPPMYSAVHYKGQRLHELARRGITVDRPSRSVEIYKFKILSIDFPFVKFECSCSKGTYMRTLVDDIGRSLGTFATLYNLERTKVSNFKIENSIKLDGIRLMVENGDFSFIENMDKSLVNIPTINLNKMYFYNIINGQKIPTELMATELEHKIYCNDIFIGIGRVVSDGVENVIRIDKMLYQE